MSLHYPVKLEMPTENMRTELYRKKFQNLSHLSCGPQNSPDLDPVDFSMWGLLQEKIYKTCITDLDELKQRLRTEWAN